MLTKLKNVMRKIGIFDSFEAKVDLLTTEKGGLASQVDSLIDDAKRHDERILQLDQHLHQLHLGHAKLIMEIEDTSRASSDLKSRMKELEERWTGRRLPYLMVPRGRRRQ